MARFWWEDQTDSKKIHWASYEKMCWPKEVRGLGFIDLHSFTLAMLAKQGWRLIQNEDSLVARILKAKYYARGSLMSVEVGSNPSFT